MTQFKVISVDEERPWSGKFGPMVSYYLTGETEKVFVNQKPDTPPITVGDTLELDISLDTDKFKTEYKKAKKSQEFKPSGGSSRQPDGPSEAYWRSKDARISRQWAVGRAIELLIANRTEGQEIRIEQLSEAADKLERLLPPLDGDQNNSVPF